MIRHQVWHDLCMGSDTRLNVYGCRQATAFVMIQYQAWHDVLFGGAKAQAHVEAAKQAKIAVVKTIAQ